MIFEIACVKWHTRYYLQITGFDIRVVLNV